MAIPGLAGAGAGGNLGTLYLTLTANAKGLITGMKSAEAAVAKSSGAMLAQAKVLAKGSALALAAVGAVSVIQWAKFDKAMTNSLAIMGDVNNAMRKEMELTARTISKNTTTSAVEAAEAYFFLASAGLSAAQSMRALNTVNMFAIAGNFDMALATDLLTDAQSALGLVVEDTTANMRNMVRVSDVLVKANTLANATVSQFSTALTREAGAALKSFNIDVEEGVAVLAAFADQGVKGEIAGTSLSRILRLMTSAAVNNTEAYREMGVAVFDSNGMIRNMADIVADLEGALSKLSDEERTVALEALGFQARVQGVILPLLGTSKAIAEYEKQLRKAGGTTDDVANKQLKSFSAQMKILWNNVNDVFVTIGEQIGPVLGALNNVLKDSETGASGLGQMFKWIVNQVGPLLVKIIGVIGDAFWGLKVVMLGIKIAVLNVIKIIVDNVAKAVQPVVNMVNEMIRDINRLPGINIPKILGMDGEGLKNLGLGLKEVIDENVLEAEKAIARGSFSERLTKEFEKIKNPVKETMDEVTDIVSDATDEIVSDFERISQAEALRNATKLIGDMHTDIFGDTGRGPSALDTPETGDPLIAQMEQMKAQEDLAKQQLEALRAISDEEVGLTEETQRRKAEVIEAYNEQLKALHAAQTEIIMGSSQQMFGDLANVTKSFAGEQSAIYKGMFAASKAFAIADATVKISQGIAAAASLGWPAMIPAIAGVVAATTSIISSIQSTQLAFGGAREKGGPVAAGKAYLVGEKGPELFSPGSNGGITPNNMLGGGSPVSIVVNNFSDATARVQESNDGEGRKVEIIIEKTKNAIASDISQGRGAVTKSMQQSFGLKRAGK